MSEPTNADPELARMRSIVGTLDAVIAYDREALEARLYGLGHNWPDSGRHRRVVLVDDLDCLSGQHPGVRVAAIFLDGQLVSFKEPGR